MKTVFLLSVFVFQIANSIPVVSMTTAGPKPVKTDASEAERRRRINNWRNQDSWDISEPSSPTGVLRVAPATPTRSLESEQQWFRSEENTKTFEEQLRLGFDWRSIRPEAARVLGVSTTKMMEIQSQIRIGLSLSEAKSAVLSGRMEVAPKAGRNPFSNFDLSE